MNGTEREKIWSWWGIASFYGVHESTVRRWSREDPGFRRLIRRWRARVFAYRDDLEYWEKQMVRVLDGPESNPH